MALLILEGSAPAAEFSVPCAGDGSDEQELIAAIDQANDEAANLGADTISLAPGCAYTFTEAHDQPGDADDDTRFYWYGPSALPAIASEITIEGNGATIARAGDATDPFRLFYVGADDADPDTWQYASPGSGELTLRDLTLRGRPRQGRQLRVRRRRPLCRRRRWWRRPGRCRLQPGPARPRRRDRDWEHGRGRLG